MRLHKSKSFILCNCIFVSVNGVIAEAYINLTKQRKTEDNRELFQLYTSATGINEVMATTRSTRRQGAQYTGLSC